MDLSFDIFQIYRQYCDLGKFPVTDFTSRTNVDEGYEELQKARIPRDALSQLLKLVESKVTTRVSILEEIYKLMSRLDLTTEFSEFLRFYDFVFFICRENGQKSITVSRAVMAWRLVLSGRFRLLNQWCNFVEKNQRHNISEDTWRQVLAFSRCVHENLEGYDPEGAWPVLIDDFVEFMYRIRGSAATTNLICNCSDLEPQQREDTLPGLKIFPGSKRKLDEDIQMDEDSSDVDAGFSGITNTKRRHVNLIEKFVNLGRNHVGSSEGDSVGIVKQNTSPLGSGIKSNCSVEGCLSRGFAELLSGNTCLQFDHDTRVPYM